MDRDKKVRLLLTGQLRALAMGQVIITASHQLALEIWVAIKKLFNALSYLEYHHLLTDLAGPQRTWVLTAVACINGNNNLAVFLFNHLFNGATDYPFFIKQINHQTVAVLLVGPEAKTLKANLGF